MTKPAQKPVPSQAKKKQDVALLLAKLDAVRFSELQQQHPAATSSSSSCAADVIIAFEESFAVYREDDGVIDQLVEMGMAQIIINGVKQQQQQQNDDARVILALQESALRILRRCVKGGPSNNNEGGETRSVELLKQGVFSFVTQLTLSPTSCSFHSTMELCLDLMLKLIQRLPHQEIKVLSHKALKDVLRVAVYHGSSASIYILSCKLFAQLFRHHPSSSLLLTSTSSSSSQSQSLLHNNIHNMGLLHEAIAKYIYEGIQMHKVYDSCQEHGRALLRYLLGHERAEQMIHYHHQKDVPHSLSTILMNSSTTTSPIRNQCSSPSRSPSSSRTT